MATDHAEIEDEDPEAGVYFEGGIYINIYIYIYIHIFLLIIYFRSLGSFRPPDPPDWGAAAPQIPNTGQSAIYGCGYN
jgi:hypothetical protein